MVAIDHKSKLTWLVKMINPALEVIDRKLDDIRKKINLRESDLSSLRAELQQVEHELEQHQAMLRMYARLREEIAEVVGEDQEAPAASGGLGPSKAIVALLGRQPALERSQIIDALEHQIASKAKDKRQVLSATIDYLEERGKICRDGANRFRQALPSK